MKTPAAERIAIRAYPHVILSVGHRRNWRRGVLAANTPVPDPEDGSWVIAGRGTVGRDGTLSSVGRRALIRAVGERARTSNAHYCIVWDEHACTYLLRDGSAVDGLTPPTGDENVAEDPAFETSPIECEPVWSRPIGGRGPAYLCIRREGRFVEVSPGARIILADFRRFPAGCENDPAAALRRASGAWNRGGSWRGQPIYDIVANGLVLGPVQPLDNARPIILKSPWPHQLQAACDEVARRRLPRAIINAAWAEVESRGESLPIIDLLEAA
jgi:hypothetical protein